MNAAGNINAATYSAMRKETKVFIPNVKHLYRLALDALHNITDTRGITDHLLSSLTHNSYQSETDEDGDDDDQSDAQDNHQLRYQRGNYFVPNLSKFYRFLD
jgi:hypothetical protein